MPSHTLFSLRAAGSLLRAAGVTLAAVALPFGLVVAPAHADTVPPTPTPPSTPAAPTPVATSITLTSKTGATVDAGKKLRLRVQVRPKVAGSVALTDSGKRVDTRAVRDGHATFVLTPRPGKHHYVATFTPKQSAAYAPASSPTVPVTAGIARRLPIGKGAYGPLVRKTQQRLVRSGILVKQTGAYDKATVAAVKRFQGKFFLRQTGIVNERTMAQLKAVQLKQLPRACRTASRSICIDKTRKVAQLVVDGKVKLSLDARFGSVRTPGLATREGVFSVQRKAVHHISSAYHSSMPYSMFFSGGQAVHYSQYFAADGYNGASHGCVNIRDYEGVATMYRKAPLGTRVVVYRS